MKTIRITKRAELETGPSKNPTVVTENFGWIHLRFYNGKKKWNGDAMWTEIALPWGDFDRIVAAANSIRPMAYDLEETPTTNPQAEEAE